MAYRRVDEIVMEHARILFRNFAGREDRYNRAGDRNFSVIIPDAEMAEALKSDGWNVKSLNPREEGEEPTYYLPVAVSYRNVPPKVYMVTRKKKTLLTEDTVKLIDSADIADIDLTISPYCWEAQGNFGIKAYLKSMYVTIEEDAFAYKYEMLDDTDEYEREVPFN